MSEFIERCRGLIENRGPLGFLVFILKSVVRHTQDIVFDKDPRDSASAYHRSLASDFKIHVIDRESIAQPELEWLLNQALAGENSIYKNGLTKDNCLVAVTKDEIVVHHSFVQFETNYKKILKEPNEVPLIGNCWTSAECRGQGIYPYIISECARVMASRGFDRILISCAPDNLASIAGIEKTGFKRVRAVNTYVFLTKIMFQKLKTEQAHHYRFGFL